MNHPNEGKEARDDSPEPGPGHPTMLTTPGSGNPNTPALPMTDAEVNHLRRLLALLRVECMLDSDMQRGYLGGAHDAVRLGIATEEVASAIVQQKANEINSCPAYVRQAVKMLTKALREHERATGIVDTAK